MRRRCAILLLGLCLLPAAAYADPLLMQLQLALTPLSRLLFFGARIWVLVFFVMALGKLWRVVRGPTKDKHHSRREALARFARLLVWGALPAIAISYLLDRPALADKTPALLVGAVWTLLFAPGLFVPPAHPRARWLRLAALIAGDLSGASLLLWQVMVGGRELAPWPLVAFVLILHAAVATGFVARGQRFPFTRGAALLTLLFLAAGFFIPPAQAADRVRHEFGAVVQAPVNKGPVRSAVFERGGQTAVVCFEREPQRLYQVVLNSNQAQIIFATEGARLDRLAMDPSRQLLVASTQTGGDREAYLFTAMPFSLRGVYTSSETARAVGLSLGAQQLAFGTAGSKANFRLCPIKEGRGGSLWSIEQVCRNLTLPLARIGSVLIASDRGLAVAAEGSDAFLDGWRLVSVAVTNGYIMRTALVGRGLGEMVYDPPMYSLYLARPARGTVDMFVVETLSYAYSIPLETGVEFLALDSERRLLLAANPQTGRLIVYDLRRRAVAARVAIGSGIVQLDYDQSTATALVAAARGLVLVKLLELRGLELH